MKKNVMMRIASVLLVAVLLSTCAISGTFAKYVTSASGSDTARVAKFGVQLNVGSNSFADQYETDDEAYSSNITWSVDSDNGDDVVAPGTKDDTGVVFSISGTPEVAVKIDTVIADGFEDVYLKTGTYTDFTEVIGYSDENIPLYKTFTLSEDYYPIVYTLTQTKNGEGADNRVIATGNLAAIKEALAEYTEKAAYGPNTKLDSEFTLTWEWTFEGNDKADTWLGNAAAGLFYDTVTDGTDYNLNIKYDLTVTVTQID